METDAQAIGDVVAEQCSSDHHLLSPVHKVRTKLRRSECHRNFNYPGVACAVINRLTLRCSTGRLRPSTAWWFSVSSSSLKYLHERKSPISECMLETGTQSSCTPGKLGSV